MVDTPIYDVLTAVARQRALITEAELIRRIGDDPVSDDIQRQVRHQLEVFVEADARAGRPLVSLMVQVPLTDAPLGYLRMVCARVGAYTGSMGDAQAWSTFVQDARARVYDDYQRRR